MAQQKFLVTGATGDTGGYTVEQLLERGHAVRALAHREDDRSKRLEKMGAEVVIGDFLKFNDVRAAMRGKVARAVEMTGFALSGFKGAFQEVRLDPNAEVVSAYYLVGAESLS